MDTSISGYKHENRSNQHQYLFHKSAKCLRFFGLFFLTGALFITIVIISLGTCAISINVFDSPWEL